MTTKFNQLVFAPVTSCPITCHAPMALNRLWFKPKGRVRPYE